MGTWAVRCGIAPTSNNVLW